MLPSSPWENCGPDIFRKKCFSSGIQYNHDNYDQLEHFWFALLWVKGLSEKEDWPEKSISVIGFLFRDWFQPGRAGGADARAGV